MSPASFPGSRSPPASIPAPSGACEEQERPRLCVSSAQEQPTHLWVTNAVSSTTPDHSPIPDTRKKYNSTPVQTSTSPLHKAEPPARGSRLRPTCPSRCPAGRVPCHQKRWSLSQGHCHGPPAAGTGRSRGSCPTSPSPIASLSPSTAAVAQAGSECFWLKIN